MECEFKYHNERNIQRTKDVFCEENITFAQLNLKNDIKKGLFNKGFKYPSPIQFKSIPMGLLGLDLIIQAKSGTGKTCVFSVLSLESINISSKIPQVLILSPTREIALQSKNVITSIGSYLDNLNCHSFIGGTKVYEDLKNLKNCNIVVGTPGRIKYLIEENHLQVDFIRLFILDEADMLFADHFQNIINWIYNSLPLHKQMITLSATYTEDMIDIITKYMKCPTIIRLNNNEKAALVGIKHYYKEIECLSTNQQIFWSKTDMLMKILSSVDFQQCIVFSNYQSVAQDLCDALECNGWSAAYISGSLDQSQRIDIFNKLKNFYCRVLIATDLISRGIDAENVNLIINLEVPMEYETYLHRMGRAGRYGSYGAVLNIVTQEEKLLLDNIKNMCDIKLQMFPDVIPCDLLEEGSFVSTSDITVEKIVDSKSTNNLYKLFHVSEDYGDNELLESNKRVHKVELSFQVIRQIQNDFKNKVTMSDLTIQNRSFELFNPLFYQTVNKLSTLKQNEKISVTESQDKEIDNKDELICQCYRNRDNVEVEVLEAEYGRLYSWANYYSQEYQRISDLIFTKNQELDSLTVT